MSFLFEIPDNLEIYGGALIPDLKELQILCNLRINSRISLTELSKKTGIPVSTIHDKLKSNNTVQKYIALLDFSKLGYGAKANIIVSVDKTQKNDLKDFLMKHQNVNTVCKINNGFDFMIEVIFRDLKEVERFVESIEESFNIDSKQVFYVVDELKKEHFLSNPHLV